MLEFYATSGDFTRRLTDIRANAKFSSPLAGPEDLYSVRACLTPADAHQLKKCCKWATSYGCNGQHFLRFSPWITMNVHARGPNNLNTQKPRHGHQVHYESG